MTAWKQAGKTVSREQRIRRILNGYRLLDDTLKSELKEQLRAVPWCTLSDGAGSAGEPRDAEFVADVRIFGFRNQGWPLFSRNMIPYAKGTLLLVANPPFEMVDSWDILLDHQVPRDARLNPILWKNTVYVDATDKEIAFPIRPLADYLNDPDALRECVQAMMRKMAREMVAPLQTP